METDNVTAATNGENDSADQNDPKRKRSTIEFPYMDLATAVEIAQGVFHRNGGADVQADELAAQLKLSSTSSGFRTRLATARTFGLIESVRGSDNISLTDLGLEIVDKNLARRAKADAFSRVELFRTVYEAFKGVQLPPAAALERRMQELGVASKQTERARQIFERSAETAGYFDSGRDRLIRPANLGSEEPDKSSDNKGGGDDGSDGRGDGGAGSGTGTLADQSEIHAAVLGILEILPPIGTKWPAKQRAKWLSSLNNVFDLIYEGDDIEIEISVDRQNQN